MPWRKKWQPTPVFLPGESHGQRSLGGYSPWPHKESDTTEWLSLSFTDDSDHLWRPREVRRLAPPHPGNEGLVLTSSLSALDSWPPSPPPLLPPQTSTGQPSCPLIPLSSPSVKTPSHPLQLPILFLLSPLFWLWFSSTPSCACPGV